MKKYKKEARIKSRTAALLQFMLIGEQLLLALLLFTAVRAQAPQQPDVWEPLKYFGFFGNSRGSPYILWSLKSE